MVLAAGPGTPAGADGVGVETLPPSAISLTTARIEPREIPRDNQLNTVHNYLTLFVRGAVKIAIHWQVDAYAAIKRGI